MFLTLDISFQEVQELSALQSSIRYFSQIVMGTSTNVALIYLIPRVRALTLTVTSACITLVSPAIMATVAVDQSYWTGPFWALLLCPVNPWGECRAENSSRRYLFANPDRLLLQCFSAYRIS